LTGTGFTTRIIFGIGLTTDIGFGKKPLNFASSLGIGFRIGLTMGIGFDVGL